MEAKLYAELMGLIKFIMKQNQTCHEIKKIKELHRGDIVLVFKNTNKVMKVIFCC